jgi:hypothetical protein
MRIVHRIAGLALAAFVSARVACAAGLRVTLTPPHDPDGLLWKLELRSVEPDALVGEYGTAPDGTWSKRGLPAKSRVNLVVKTDSGQPWWKSEEPIALEEEITTKSIALGLVKVAGTLSWGGGPIRAELKFKDARVGTLVSTSSKKDGTFEIAVPRWGDWDVTVTGRRPPVKQQVRADVFEDRDGVGRTAIALESGCICGEVFDEQGHPIPIAFVRMVGKRSTEYDVSLKPEADGTFRNDRLPPGTYRVSADGHHITTEAVVVELQPRIGAPWITLVAKKESMIRGRVVDERGQPVKNVMLRAVAPPGSMLGLEGGDRTDEDGHFEVGVYPGLDERCLTIGPPGRGHDLVKLKVDTDDQLVTLTPVTAAGILEIRFSADGPLPWLFRNGCSAPIWMTGGFQLADAQSWMGQVRLAPGPWSLCPGDEAKLVASKEAPFADCVNVLVPPGGSVQATLPPP